MKLRNILRKTFTAASMVFLLAAFLRLAVGPQGTAAAQAPGATATATFAPAPATQTPGAPLKAAGPAQFIPGEIIVRFEAGVSAARIRQTLAAYAGAQAGALAGAQPLAVPELEAAVVAVPAGGELAAVQALRAAPGVAFAELNYLAQSQDITPNDSNWDLQYGPASIQAPAAWEITTGSTAVIIAVVDSGVDLQHPDLDDKIWVNPGEAGLDGNGLDKRTNGLDDDSNGFVDDWHGWDFANGDNNPRDDFYHGTHVAGIAAAETDNAQGVAGVSWGARIMPVKVLGSGGFGSYSDVAAGIIYAADQGAQVINLSLGGSAPSSLLEQAVDYATGKGSLVVAAAGNSPGLPVIYPAAYENALAVASVDAANQRSSFSTYGPQVDIAGPGSSVYSTFWNGSSTYGYLSGTSMATPHVAGVAALLAGTTGFDTPAKIRAALEATALDLGPVGLDWLFGHGLVQAYTALQFDPESVAPTPVPTATYTPQAPETHGVSCPGAGGFDWVSATSGVNTNLKEDDLFVPADLPFEFVFGGYTYTEVYISSNGYLTFGDDATRWINAPIPNAGAPNMFIAPYWDDLNPQAGGSIYFTTLGSAPARRFVIEWNAVPLYSASGINHGQGALTFQAILHEDTNEISFQYLSLQGTGARGDSATIGVEYADGAAGVQHAYNMPLSVSDGLVIRFVPTAGPPPPPDPAEKCPPEVYYFPLMHKSN